MLYEINHSQNSQAETYNSYKNNNQTYISFASTTMEGNNPQQIQAAMHILDVLQELNEARMAALLDEDPDNKENAREDEEEEVASPIMLSFIAQGGNDVIKKMTNFTVDELRELWEQLERLHC
jgi:hypothetical protein